MHGLVRRLALVLALALAPTALGAQSVVVAVEEENFRATPDGTVLAVLVEGTTLVPGEADGRWRETTLEAWIWAPSVEAESRVGYDLTVSADGGENLRATPNGRRLGRAREGMLLDSLESRGDWIRIQRTGWIWAPSVRFAADPTPAPPSEPEARPSTREFSRAGEAAVVRSAPGGDTLAPLRSGAEVEVLARDGEWVRVRLEGWTAAASLGADAGAPDAGVLTGVTREELQTEPGQYRGRRLQWTLQFIALQEAERFRTDLLPGERFVLARGPGDDAGFVYLAVSDELVEEVETLTPLQRFRVVGRVRNVESPLTGAPVLDLIEITGR